MDYFLNKVKDEIRAEVAQLLAAEASAVTIEYPKDDIGSDLAIPVFKFAAQKRSKPDQLASELAQKLKLDVAQKIEPKGGFLNIWIKPEFFAKGLVADSDTKIYGSSNVGVDQKIVVDFIGLNLSKPFSVGHLRPTVQGWALIQIFRKLGYEVIGDSHLGDWGTPFGMWVVAYEKWGNEEQLARDGAYELGRLYVKFRQEAKKDESLIDQAKQWLKKLESNDETALSYKEKFSKISLDHAASVLAHLKVVADENLGESFYIERAQELVDELIADGVAHQQEDGSVIADLSSEGIETPILLRKADGSALYATSDLMTIKYRMDQWRPRKIIYSVGAEQQFHFKQVFTLAQKLGWVEETDLVHAWFGTVDEIDPETGKRGKMSSRKNTALLENLIEQAKQKAAEAVVNKSDMSQQDIDRVAIGAIKFNDFAQPRQTNMLFDWEAMFNLHGRSAPYIQYAAVRAGSVLGSANLKPKFNEEYDWLTEKDLLTWLSRYPEAVQEAADNYEPFVIAEYLYQLARRWNRYYEETPILKAQPDEVSSRLWLTETLRFVLTDGLDLLGIEVPAKM